MGGGAVVAVEGGVLNRMEGMQAGFWCGGTVAPIGRTAKSVAGSRTGLIGGGFCRVREELSCVDLGVKRV